jgi:hypothetical protein
VFCNNATIKNVMIVVTVLMISCHVSIDPSRKKLGAQMTTSNTQNVKNVARATRFDVHVAKRSNKPTCSVTSLGMTAGARLAPSRATSVDMLRYVYLHAALGNVPVGTSTTSPMRADRKARGMYIGIGTLVVILIIILIIYFLRRA